MDDSINFGITDFDKCFEYLASLSTYQFQYVLEHLNKHPEYSNNILLLLYDAYHNTEQDTINHLIDIGILATAIVKK